MILADWGSDPKNKQNISTGFEPDNLHRTYYLVSVFTILKRSLTHVSMTTKFQKYIKNMIMQTQAAKLSGFRTPLPECWFGAVLFASVNL